MWVSETQVCGPPYSAFLGHYQGAESQVEQPGLMPVPTLIWMQVLASLSVP